MWALTPLALLFSTITTLSYAQNTTNCTDPLNYIQHPFLFLEAHPILTRDIDRLCHDLHFFDKFLSNINVTTVVSNHPNLHLNATEITDALQNITSAIDGLEANSTLVKLCKRADAVVDACWPLTWKTWRLNRPDDCRADPTQDEIDAAGKNATLVRRCKVFVDDVNNNVTVTDAAVAADNVDLTSAASSTMATSASATSSGTTSTTSSKTNAASHLESMRGGLFLSLFVIVVGAASLC